MSNHQKLTQLRNHIDEVDQQLVSLLAKRMHIVDQIGKYKLEHNIEPLDKSRWQSVLDSVVSLAKKKHISPKLVNSIYQTIHQHALQKETQLKKNTK